jgi:hypothetical protein
VAGRGHLDGLLLDLCLGCHKYLTGRQYDVGILPYEGPTSLDDRVRAGAVGILLVLGLLDQVHPMTLSLDDRLMARAVPQALDLLAPADRMARWGPDPIGAALRPTRRPPPPAELSMEAQADVGVAVTRLVGEFIDRFDPDPTMVARVRDVVAQAPRLVADWEAAMTDPDLAGQVQHWLGRLVELLQHAARDIVAGLDLRQLVEAHLADLEVAFEEWMVLVSEIQAHTPGAEL